MSNSYSCNITHVIIIAFSSAVLSYRAHKPKQQLSLSNKVADN